jgi:hypothetical protein
VGLSAVAILGVLKRWGIATDLALEFCDSSDCFLRSARSFISFRCPPPPRIIVQLVPSNPYLYIIPILEILKRREVTLDEL